jgi:hypothetical protein
MVRWVSVTQEHVFLVPGKVAMWMDLFLPLYVTKKTSTLKRPLKAMLRREGA